MRQELRIYDAAEYNLSQDMLVAAPLTDIDRTYTITANQLLQYGEEHYVELIDRYLTDTNIQQVVFRRLGDGIEIDVARIINNIVKFFVESELLTIENFTYITNIDCTALNLTKYRQLQKQFPYLPEHLCSRDNTADLSGGCRHIWKHSDSQLALDVYPKNKNFLCFNRALRLPRIVFMMELANRGLLEDTHASLRNPYNAESEEKQVINSILKKNQQWLDKTGFSSVSVEPLLDSMPLSLDYQVDRLFSLNAHDINLFNSSRVSIVNEALFHSSHTEYLDVDELGTFLPFSLTSEKIIKCMMMGHPFLAVSTPGHLESIRQLGYKTFHPVIDESYDLIQDDHARMQAVLTEIDRLNRYTEAEWLEFAAAIRDTVRYNQLVFKEKSIDVPYMSWLSDNA